MRKKIPFLAEILTVLALVAVPFVLPHLGFTPTTINRILILGLVGIGFDLLFGYTGLLSFGQSAFFGSGGMLAAYLLTQTSFTNTVGAVLLGTVAAGVIGFLIGLIALRRTGIYFAMITVAIAEVFFFVEFNPLSHWTGGENGLPGVPTPSIDIGSFHYAFTNGWSLYIFLAVCYFIGIVLALRIVRSPVGAVFSAIRDNPLRAAAVGHNIHGYKLTAFVVAAAYAGFAGGLLGLMQGFMPPDAFTFATSGQLVMQTAIGGTGTLFGPLVGATVWLFLSDFLQTTLDLGAACGTDRSRASVYGCAGRAKTVSASPDSTIRPAYMTATRSATSITTPRSCVMRSTPIPSRSRSEPSRSRICACTVTSSAVVGSSAMSSSGSSAMAMAIRMRCRIPPENWCG